MTIHVHSSFLFSRVLCFADLDLKFESNHVILCETHCKYFFCTNFACFSCPPGDPGGRQLIRYCKKLSESYRLSFLFQQVPHSRPNPSARGVVSLVFCHSCTQVCYTIMTFTGGIYILCNQDHIVNDNTICSLVFCASCTQMAHTLHNHDVDRQQR